ncbi:hypothetical protein FCV25MIE_08055 [Fagus crenata]
MNICCLNAGEDSNASKKSLDRSQYKVNVQNNLNMLEPKASKFASFGSIPRSKPAQLQNTNSKHSQDSKAVPTKASLERSDKPASQEKYDSSERDEARRLLEATKEIVNLMHKDYKGTAHRKPPINNHEPSH